MNKNKLYYLVLVAGIALIAAGLVRKDNGSSDLNGLGDLEVEEPEMLTEGDDSQKDNTGINYLEGVLYKSEDLNRGNFKLVSGTSDIYVRTSRDFSALLGLEVLAQISGTLDKFELVDIQPKVAKDGYIHQ